MCQLCPTYPKAWLEVEAQELFATNEQILHNPALAPPGWFNPFTEPEKLDQERKSSEMTGIGWQRYVEKEYPGIDSKEQKALRLEERKKDDMARCGEKRYKKWEYGPKKTVYDIWYCKRKGCPTCDKRKKMNTSKQLKDLKRKAKLYEVTEEQAKQIKSTRSKEQYQQYNNETTGKSYMVLDENDIIEIEPEEWTDEKIQEIAEADLACEHKRSSGKLTVEVEVPSSEPVEEPKQIKRRVYRLETTKESTIKDHQELDKIVAEEFEKTGDVASVDVLQDAIYCLEQLTVTVAKRHCAEIHFLYTEEVNVYLSKVDWWSIIKTPFE